MMENDGYYDGNMVAAIQSDTLHLHVHVVAYENGSKYPRKHGKEERGVLRESSLNRLAHNIDRYMESTKDLSCVPTQRFLTPEWIDDGKRDVIGETKQDTSFLDRYLILLQEQEREKAPPGHDLRRPDGYHVRGPGSGAGTGTIETLLCFCLVRGIVNIWDL